MEFLPNVQKALIYLFWRRYARECSKNFSKLLIPAVETNNFELLNEVLMNTGNRDPKALLVAVKNNNARMVNVLIAANFRPSYRMCEVAVTNGYTDCFVALIKAGHPLYNDFLYLASGMNYVDIVKFHIENATNPKYNQFRLDYKTALFLAVAGNSVETAKLLIEVNTLKEAYIVNQAVDVGNAEMLALLLDAGYNTNVDCVIKAIRRNDVTSLQMLIDVNAPLSEKCLYKAEKRGLLKCVEMLVAAGCPKQN